MSSTCLGACTHQHTAIYTSALTYNVLLQPLLGCDEVHGLVLGWRWDLHPVVLSLVHRNTVLSRLNKLVLQCLKTVETHGSHVSILHSDGSLGLLVVTEEREIHHSQGTYPLSISLDGADITYVVIVVILPTHGRHGRPHLL